MIKTLALAAAGYIGVYMMFCAVAAIGGHMMSQPYTFEQDGYVITVTAGE